MKMKYNILLLSYRGASIQHLIRQQRLHLMDCAALTNTHPGRLCHMSAPNPTWPPSAQRSFNAAMKIDIYLKGFFTDSMNLDVRIDHRQSREDDNNRNQTQKLLPLWWRVVCGLELEPESRSLTPVSQAASDNIADGFATWPIRPGHRR